jgi:hypothetical protein
MRVYTKKELALLYRDPKVLETIARIAKGLSTGKKGPTKKFRSLLKKEMDISGSQIWVEMEWFLFQESFKRVPLWINGPPEYRTKNIYWYKQNRILRTALKNFICPLVSWRLKIGR